MSLSPHDEMLLFSMLLLFSLTGAFSFLQMKQQKWAIFSLALAVLFTFFIVQDIRSM